VRICGWIYLDVVVSAVLSSSCFDPLNLEMMLGKKCDRVLNVFPEKKRVDVKSEESMWQSLSILSTLSLGSFVLSFPLRKGQHL